MILPIIAYGHPVLKRMAEDISADYPNLKELLANMWQTMENAGGVGLAAPQIGQSIRLFLVDTSEAMEEGKEDEGIRRVFINAHKVEEGGEEWGYEEGCLSIPDVTGEVFRPSQIRLRYLDEQFVEQEEIFTGVNARVIQHEYDHIDGILFTEYLKPLKRRMLKRKLTNIRVGKINPKYRMTFVQTKKR